jgi:hypothetical protein
VPVAANDTTIDSAAESGVDVVAAQSALIIRVIATAAVSDVAVEAAQVADRL